MFIGSPYNYYIYKFNTFCYICTFLYSETLIFYIPDFDWTFHLNSMKKKLRHNYYFLKHL